jgi:hypothetical protein
MRVYQTVFFTQPVFGKFSYSHLLNLDTHPRAVLTTLKSSLASIPRDVLEADCLTCLLSIDWRTNLVGCGVMLLGGATPALIDGLWGRLYRGSWIAPQLAVTAYLLDRSFQGKGLELIADNPERSKSTLSVGHLLQRTDAPLTPELNKIIDDLDSITDVNCKEITDRWLRAIINHSDLFVLR